MNMKDYPTLHKLKYRNSTSIAVLHFSHSRFFNNENNSYPKMSMKRPLDFSGP